MVVQVPHDGRGTVRFQPRFLGLLSSGGDKPPGAGTRAEGDISAKSAASPLRVVVVEDEAVIAFEIEDILEGFGVDVVGMAANAEKAVELVESQRPDCVTMDISLHGPRDGIDVAHEIYERFGVRSIFISAYGDENARSRAEPAAPIGWVTKPIRTHELAALLDLLRDRR